ncbi:hypothetical protein ACFW04_004835 [Cataglyphis niger]
MVDAAEVVVADEGPEDAVAAREAVLAEVAMEIEEDLIVLLVVAQVIVLTNGPEAAVVVWAELAMEIVNRFPKIILGVEPRAVAPAVTAKIIADMAEGVIGNKMAIESK